MVDMASEIKAMKRLWASKLLIHAKDYAEGVKFMGSVRGRDDSMRIGMFVGEARRAYAWLTSEDTAPSSFVWVCELFDLHPERTRRLIMTNWRQFLKEFKLEEKPRKRLAPETQEEVELEDDL